MPLLKLLICLATLLTLIAPVLVAAPGDLDTTFGSGGRVATAIGSSNDIAYGVQVQADGKIVVGGEFVNGALSDVVVARYLNDGTLDTSFNGNGKATLDLGSDEGLRGIVLQGDGKIVGGGYAHPGASYDFLLVRYTTGGALDSTFGSGGKVTTPIGSGDDIIRAVTMQNDGKIVVGGNSSNGSNLDFALARYNANGTLDSTFGSGGKVTLAIGTGDDVGYGVAVQDDGKIVVTGQTFNGSNADIVLVRLTTAGALDTTFNGTGKVTTNLGSSETARALALQADGKIVVAGYMTGSDDDFLTVRYTSAGALDNTFGSGGKVTTAIGPSHDQAAAVQIQNDGRIVVSGNSSNGSNRDLAAIRYTSAGVLDSTFGNGGKVTSPIGAGDEYGNAVAIQNDGKIVVAGYSDNGSNNDLAVVRYLGGPTIEQSGPITATDFVVAPIAGQTETFNNNGFDLTVSGVSSVGRSGTGTLNQSGGTHGTTTLYVGETSGSNGTYNLSGTSVLNSGANLFIGRQPGSTGSFTQSGGSINVTDEYVGTAGMGSLTQTGGTNSSQRLLVGGLSGGSGTFNLQGGSVTPGVYMRVASDGAGNVAQSGGNVVVPTLVIANGAGVTGTYTLSGTGAVNASASLTVGLSGTGTLTQTGGSLSAGSMVIAGNNGASGSYIFSSGTATVTNALTVGASGSGTMTQSGGTAQADQFYIASAVGSNSTLNLQGGSLTATTKVRIGNVATGALTQTGGTISAAEMLVGNAAGSSGTYTLNGGTATVGSLYSSAGSAAVNFSKGTLTVTSININLGPAGLVVGDGTNLATLNLGTGTHSIGNGIHVKPNATLQLSGTVAPSTLAVSLEGGTLVGNGVIGSLAATNGSKINLGDTSASTVAVGDVTLASGVTYHADVTDTTGCDQISSTGTVNLGGATLNLRLRFVPSGLRVFRIVQKSGSSFITGTFAGLPEGSSFTANDSGGTPRACYITYAGGDGNDVDVFVNVPPPQVGTGSPSNVSGTGGTLMGQVNPNGGPTQVRFEYGTTTLYGNSTTAQSVGSGTGIVNVNAPITGLSAGTTYHYRLVATNPGGTTNGNDVDFVATSGSGSGATAIPALTTSPVSGITPTSATLSGTVNPNGGATTAQFEYGETAIYGQATVSQAMGSGTNPVPIQKILTGLTPGTVYHYRLTASNLASGGNGGPNQTVDATFTTNFLPPTVTTTSASTSIAGATLRGKVNPNGVATTSVVFEYGPDTNYGASAPVAGPLTGRDPIDVTAAIAAANLTPGSTYHYRLVATTSVGTSPGNDATFVAVVPPAASTDPATNVTTAGVTLHGTVTPNQFDVNVSFEVAESESALGTAGATTVGATPASFAAGFATPQTVSAANATGFGLGLNGASKTYYYRTVVTATSGGGGSIVGDTETFTVQNTAPGAQDDVFVILGNEQLDVLKNDSDVDPADTLRIVSVDPPAGGSGEPRISVDGKKISYNPNDLFPDQPEGDSFSYTISDRATGGLTDTATVRVFSVKVLRGLYAGLIGGASDGADAAGRLDITLSPTGQVTGSFKWLGRLYTFKGGAPLGTDGKLTITKPKIGTDGRAVAGAVLELELTLDPITRVLTGTLTDTETNPDTVVQAELTGTATTDDTSTLPETGTFNAYIDTGTSSIPPESAAPEAGASLLPRGIGFAQVVVAKSGKRRPARFTGRMPDNQAFSSGARALVQALRAAAGARYPLYVDNLYPKVRNLEGRPQNGGFVSGNVAFTKQTDRFDSGLNWERRPNVGTRFPQGFRTGLAAFTATLNAIRYNRPAPFNLPAGISNDLRTVNAKIDLTDGDLPGTITRALKMTRAGNGPVRTRVEPLNVTANVEQLKITINATTGKFSGSFIHPNDAANPALRRKPRTPFSGVFKGQDGEGTFTGPVNTGRIQIIGQ